MSDADLALLSRLLNMVMTLPAKLPAVAETPGVARLGWFSGLFLLRGDAPEQWRLEVRTWGAPAADVAHRWHLDAADAARLLDPSVPRPAPLIAPITATAPAHDGHRLWSGRARRQ